KRSNALDLSKNGQEAEPRQNAEAKPSEPRLTLNKNTKETEETTMLQAMLAGVTSIKAQQTRMNVIGNNLANVNTTAFKGSRIGFQDMLSQTIRGASTSTGNRGGLNPLQLGLGV